MYSIILIFLIAKTQATIQLGRIPNANWILNLSQTDNEYINISNTTCNQCLCRMLQTNNLTISIACQQKLKTCQLLFWNVTAHLQSDEISVVYFQTIPYFLLITTSQQPVTTSISSDLSNAVTTKAITSSSVITSSAVITSSPAVTLSATITSSKVITSFPAITSSATITSSSAITSMNPPSTLITTASKTTILTSVPILLINPGAEYGTVEPWTPSSSSAPTVNNGKGSGGTVTPYNGSYAFYGGAGSGSLYQNVSLTNTFSTTQLDSGSLSVSISYWERSSSTSAADTAQVKLIFFSATNTILSSVTTATKACTSAWCRVTGIWLLPTGTRTIQYVMLFAVNGGGNYADAWIDDNILNVA